MGNLSTHMYGCGTGSAAGNSSFNGSPAIDYDRSWYKETAWYEALSSFHSAYFKVHGWVSMVICISGILSNLMSMIVLTRPGLISVATALLTAVAACDSVLMMSYAVYVGHFVLTPHEPDPCSNGPTHTLGWVRFSLVHANLSVLAHTTSLWLTCALAVYRFILIRSVNQPHITPGTGTGTGLSTAYWITGMILASVTALCVPNFLIYGPEEATPVLLRRVCEAAVLENNFDCVETGLKMPIIDREEFIANAFWQVNGSTPQARAVIATCLAQYLPVTYRPGFSQRAFWNNCMLQAVNFWIGGLAFKIGPCLVLSVFMMLILCSLVKTQERRKQLMFKFYRARPSHRPSTPAQGTIHLEPSNRSVQLVQNGSSRKSSSGQTNPLRAPVGHNTTPMLLAIMFVFLITELPQGVLTLLAGLLGQWFHAGIYRPLGDVLDLLSLFNSSVNFVLYCTMSVAFRREAARLANPGRLLALLRHSKLSTGSGSHQGVFRHRTFSNAHSGAELRLTSGHFTNHRTSEKPICSTEFGGFNNNNTYGATDEAWIKPNTLSPPSSGPPSHSK